MSKSLNIKDFRWAIEPILETDEPENRLPILIRGEHGIGKSDLVYQMGREMGFDEDRIIERRASQMVEGDLIGMPDRMEGLSIPMKMALNWFLTRDVEDVVSDAPKFIQSTLQWLFNEDSISDLLERISDITETPFTAWKPPEWLHRACRERCLLFFDEVDRAMVSVRQGLFELTGSRKLYGNELHPETVIFAAINGGEDVTDYTVGEMDPAELDRWFTIDLEPTVEEWLEWAYDNGVNEYVTEFISDNPDHLEFDRDQGEYSPGKMYPSRRSWDRFSRILNEKYPNQKPDHEWVFVHGQGQVGHKTALKFAEFVKEHEDKISLDDILNDQDGSVIQKAAEKGQNAHHSICEQFAAKYEGDELDDGQLENLADYMVTALHDEMTMSLFKSIESRDARDRLFSLSHPDIVNNSDIDGDEMGDYILELYESDEEVREAETFSSDDDDEAEAEA